MAHRLDSAISKALSLETTASIAHHGGSGFASTFKINSKTLDGAERDFFVKTGKGKKSEVMFAGEHESLNAIHDIVPNLCPRSLSNGKLSDNSGSYLATEFLNLSPSKTSSTPGSGTSLAQKLVILHSTPAPTLDEYETPMFGFPVTTCCGKTPQDNSFKTTWAEFYAENRLRGILRSAKPSQGSDSELEQLVETTVTSVVPRLLANGHLQAANGGGDIIPVIVHGDLWSGNHGRGVIGEGGIEEVVFDPSSCWAHSEFEFGIMKMFGGFDDTFYDEYQELKSKDEPVDEWEDRVKLYGLYHQLNHYAMFGGGYRNGAVNIMRRLISKYKDDM